MSNTQEFRDGWNTVMESYKTKKIQHVSFISEVAMNTAPESIIRESVSQQLYEKLKESKYVDYKIRKIQSVENPYNTQYEVNATICIVDREFSNIMQETNKMYINDVEFTEDEIIQSLKNTFPEKLI